MTRRDEIVPSVRSPGERAWQTDLLLLLLNVVVLLDLEIMHIKDLPRQRFHHVQKLLLSVRVDVSESVCVSE